MTIELVSNKGAIDISKQLAKGDDGGYYTPSVDDEGNLSWVASEEDMPEIEPVNIRGVKGDKGDDGITPVHIGAEEPTDDNVVIWLWTEPDVIQSAEEVDY